jgi:hypothetical protein
MRWFLAAFFFVGFVSVSGASHAVTLGTATTSVESAREATSVTQDVAARRHHRRHHPRHRRVMPR